MSTIISEENFIKITKTIFETVKLSVPKENHFVVAVGCNIDGHFRSRMYHPDITNYDRAVLLIADATMKLKYHFGDMVTPATKMISKLTITKMQERINEHIFPGLLLCIKIISGGNRTVIISNLAEDVKIPFLQSFKREHVTGTTPISTPTSIRII